MVFDQASAAMARGEIQIAARESHEVPLGVGVDKYGEATKDPNEILNGGAQLAFGGYKGASIALMIDLLAGPLIGEVTSMEAGRRDPRDGGPPTSGELVIAIDPTRFGAAGTFSERAEGLFDELCSQEGVRLPGERRYRNREKTPEAGFEIPQALHATIVEAAG